MLNNAVKMHCLPTSLSELLSEDEHCNIRGQPFRKASFVNKPEAGSRVLILILLNTYMYDLEDPYLFTII